MWIIDFSWVIYGVSSAELLEHGDTAHWSLCPAWLGCCVTGSNPLKLLIFNWKKRRLAAFFFCATVNHPQRWLGHAEAEEGEIRGIVNVPFWLFLPQIQLVQPGQIQIQGGQAVQVQGQQGQTQQIIIQQPQTAVTAGQTQVTAPAWKAFLQRIRKRNLTNDLRCG